MPDRVTLPPPESIKAWLPPLSLIGPKIVRLVPTAAATLRLSRSTTGAFIASLPLVTEIDAELPLLANCSELPPLPLRA